MRPPVATVPQAIGQTENALRAVIHRTLEATGTTFPQWVALTMLSAGSTPIEVGQLTARITGALKIEAAASAAAVDHLTTTQLAYRSTGGTPHMSLTQAGHLHYRHLRAAVDEITDRLTGDLPTEDIATTLRVLALIATRAEGELSGTPH